MSVNLKRVNLQQIQKPKTLIVIHYKGKRVSIPLFESTHNITEYLWQQLKKFQASVLEKEDKVSNSRSKDINSIVGFTAIQQQKNKIDIKMNILLSMSRVYWETGKSRTDLKQLDITLYYKYLQIEPYYGFNTKQLIPQYQLHSVLNTGDYFTVYLGRRVSDGRFYSVKIAKNDNKIAQNQYSIMKSILHDQSQFQNKNELQLIPQIQQVRKAQGFYIFIYEYCPGGTLRNAITNKKLSQIQCLHYMKQLVWGVHTLNTVFNLVHRAICYQNIQIDFVGNLRLMNFAYCQPCFTTNSREQSSVPESYEQKYEINHVKVPPEVQRSGKYNYLVDYYGVGAVLCEMFVQESNFTAKRNKDGIQVAIQSLQAENIKEREYCVNQIVSQIFDEKKNRYSPAKGQDILENQRLTFNKIYIGESINIEQKSKNGIKHQDAMKVLKANSDEQYYLHPVNKSRKKSKNKSKSKEGKDISKNKSKSKNQASSKSIQSNSIISTDKSLISKNSNVSKNKIKGSDHSVNKSVDSRNNSAKSEKKKKSQPKIPKQITKNTQNIIGVIPKSPIAIKNLKQTHKSPTKEVRQKAKSPTKILGSMMKTRI